MGASLPRNEHPLNARSAELLRELKRPPEPDSLYLLQLLIAAIEDDLPPGTADALLRLNPEKVMEKVEPVLPVEALDDATPEQAAYLIAEALELDLNEAAA